MLAETEDAIRHNDQGRAAAAIQIYGERGYAAGPVFNLMLKYAVSEDGRLHGEKYFHTVCEEYRTTRPAFRWRQMVALARVTAKRLRLQPRRQARLSRGRLRRSLQTARRRDLKRQAA